MTVKTLSILILSDGRVGHINRSEGVIMAISQKIKVEVTKLDLKVPRFIPKAFLPRLARRIPAKLFLRLIHKLDAKKYSDFDLIISAGGKTIGANVSLAELLKVPNIYVGKTRGISPKLFAISMPPYAFYGKKKVNKIEWTPVKINPDLLPLPKTSIQKVGILLGGTTKQIFFEDEDWEAFMSLINDLLLKEKYSIVIATSPRTPKTVYNKLNKLHSPKLQIIDYRIEGGGSSQKVFECDAIIAGADSTTMLAEAIASKRPVVGVLPKYANLNKEYNELKLQEGKGRLNFAQLPISADDCIKMLKAQVPVNFNHLDILVEAIIADLPELV